MHSTEETSQARDNGHALFHTAMERAKKANPCARAATIYKVPDALRQLNQSAYTPQLLSIGPLHWELKYLKPQMEDAKHSYVSKLLERTAGNGNPDIIERQTEEKFKECLTAMEGLLNEARGCYAEESDALDEKMMVIDGCFIIELFYRYFRKSAPYNDPLLGSYMAKHLVTLDLLLLESQLPLFVLEKLFELTVKCIPNPDPEEADMTVTDYALSFFEDILYFEPRNGRAVTNNTQNPTKPYHILHLLHEEYRPPYQPTEVKGSKFRRTASDLDLSGVKFTAAANNNRMFNVKFQEPPVVASWFKRARFELPKLLIDDNTETYLRNLIAFEQCCPGVSFHITSYADLMDTLIDDEKDVNLLENAGVICNFLGSDEYAKGLFNNICKQVFVGESYFAEQCHRAEKYQGRFWPRNLAYLKRTYLDSPWTFIGFTIAFIAFGITVTNFILNLL